MAANAGFLADPESKETNSSKLRRDLSGQISELEQITIQIKGVFLRGSGLVCDEPLSIENLEGLRIMVVSQYATASALWGRVKGIVARGDAKVRVERSKAFMKARRLGKREAGDPDDSPEFSDGRVPGQKDAELMAYAMTERYTLEYAEWEAMLARCTAVSNSLQAFSEAITNLGWMRYREYSATQR